VKEDMRDALAPLHQRTLELIVRGASLQVVLDALCDGIDALDPDLMSSVLLADADGVYVLSADELLYRDNCLPRNR